MEITLFFTINCLYKVNSSRKSFWFYPSSLSRLEINYMFSIVQQRYFVNVRSASHQARIHFFVVPEKVFKALKAFIKPFKVKERSMKKNQVNFLPSSTVGPGRVKAEGSRSSLFLLT